MKAKQEEKRKMNIKSLLEKEQQLKKNVQKYKENSVVSETVSGVTPVCY